MKKTSYFKIPLIFLMVIFIFSCSSDNTATVGEDSTAQPEPEPEPGPDPILESEVPVGPSILKINSGGGELNFDSEVFEADKYFTGDVDLFVNHIVTEIAETDLDELYLSLRSSATNKDRFAYAIPVTNGTYTVKFYFAEIVWGAINDPEYPGEENRRIFGVDVEGVNQISNLDIYKEVGSTTAITRMYDVEVSDGELTISLKSNVDRPMLSALEIFGEGEIVID